MILSHKLNLVQRNTNAEPLYALLLKRHQPTY